MPIKIAINGFGRIGRPTFKRILDKHSGLEVVAINDLGDIKTLSHLLKYDSLYGVYNKEIKAEVFSEKDPSSLPWKKLGVDVVLECTGYFRDLEGAGKHLEAGAKKVVISAPAKSDEIPTYVLGVNENDYNPQRDNIISMGSCTTNCLAPVAKVIDEELGIEEAFMTTVHSYTNDQKILDLVHTDLRRARTAGVNIIPTTTGATKSVEECLPQLKGKLKGLALRVPTPVVSIIDLVARTKKKTSVEKLNDLFKKASEMPELKGILGVEERPLVSSDFKGSPYSAIVDILSTQAFDNFVKVLAWYDNEFGYACRLAEFAEFVGKK